MATIYIGKPAPDVRLMDMTGNAIQLSEAWSSGRHALIIFLRHLA